MYIKRFCLLLLFIPLLFITACASKSGASGTEKKAASGFTISSNDRGTEDGYDYEFWKNSNAEGKMTIKDAGTFNCEWSSNGSGSNILFRMGKRFGNSRTHKQVGDISITYAANYSPEGTSYLSIYGWTQNPLIEYYVVDNYYGSYHPGRAGTFKGEFTIKGEGTYEVYTREMKQQPAIAGPGNYNFTQYISVRTEKRSSGKISVSKHFNEWEKLGLDMSGKLFEAMMKVEGYGSSGSAEITENKLTIN